MTHSQELLNDFCDRHGLPKDVFRVEIVLDCHTSEMIVHHRVVDGTKLRKTMSLWSIVGERKTKFPVVTGLSK